MALARIPKKQLDSTVMVEGEDASLLGSGAATVGQTPVADGAGNLSFNDLDAGASGAAAVGQVLTADGAGGVSFSATAADSFFSKTVGTGGDFADIGAAIDAASGSISSFGVLLILEQVSWGTPTLTLDIPMIFQGVASDAEVNIDGDTNIVVDLGSTSSLAYLDFRSLAITRDAANTGMFDMSLHDAEIRISDCTITDSTTNVASEGIFDGDGEALTAFLENVVIDSAGVEAKLFSRWNTASVSCAGLQASTSAEFLDTVPTATISLDRYSVLNDVGLAGTTFSVTYKQSSLMINVSGGGTLTSATGAASYNSILDGVAGVDWVAAINGLVGSELNIEEGAFTSTDDGAVVATGVKVSGAGKDLTTLTSTATGGVRIVQLQGAGSSIDNASIVAGNVTDSPIILDSSAADLSVKNMRFEQQSDTDAAGIMVSVSGDDTSFSGCEFLVSGDRNAATYLDTQDAADVTIRGCEFLYEGAADATAATIIDGSSTPAGSLIRFFGNRIDMGASTATGSIILSLNAAADCSLSAQKNNVAGNIQNFISDSGSLSNSIINGNTCDFSLGGAATSSVIIIQGVVSSLIISNNTFLNCSDNGIQIDVGTSASTTIVIADNAITGNALNDTGIIFAGDITKSVIRGNMIDNFATGILTSTSGGQNPDNNQYMGNHLEGNTAPITLDASDTSEIAHNVEDV